MYAFDMQFGEVSPIAGVDEVGRGPLAGPIVGAAVVLNYKILNDEELLLGIKDSKKLSAAKREELSEVIKKKALYYHIFSMDSEQIDEKGIAFCNNEVLKQACLKLPITPQLVLSDGYPIRNYEGNNKYVIKGDSKSASIACASIIAKVYRDAVMRDYAEKYPQYGFDSNVGYGTKEHVDSILEFGITPIHRRSFLKKIIDGKDA
jgi:ribonuclease HII